MSTERSNDLIRNLMLNNYIGAQDAFEDIMSEKVLGALDNITLGITDAMFNDDVCEQCEEDIEEAKMADKDYDGDGKVETGTAEWKGSRDKAIKKAMATRKEEVEELDELKSSTLSSYVTKRSGQVRSDLSTGNHSPKTNKKAAGVSAALSRLDARKQLGGAHPQSQRGQEWAKLARLHPKDKSAYDLRGNK